MTDSLRLAVRAVARRPGWAAALVLTLGLGVGANVAVFSVASATLLRTLPYPQPERLLLAWEARPDRGWNRFGVSAPAFRDWQRLEAFEHAVAYYESEANVAGATGAERVRVLSATPDLLPTLGLAPHLGRGLNQGDTDAALLGFAFWQTAFGADPAVLGRPVRVGRETLTIVGVLPPAFGAPFASPGLVRPLAIADDERRGARWLSVLARVRSGRTAAAAQAELDALARRSASDFPRTNAGWTVTTAGLRDAVAEDDRRPVLLLGGAAALLLLLACANAANLMLVRALGRERELAVRAALGAGAAHLLRPIAAEALLLGAVGGVVGLGLAALCRDRLRAALLDSPAAPATPIDGRVLAFGLAVTLAAVALVAALPVVHAWRANAAAALRAGSAAVLTPGRRRSRRALVVAEVALAFVLLAAAGMLVRSVRRLLDVDAGFRPERALAFRVAPPQVAPEPGQSEEAFVAAYLADRDRAAGFYGRALERLRALPGIRDVAAVNRLPLTGGWWVVGYAVPGRAASAPGEDRNAFGRVVTPGYFRTMGTPLVAGRELLESDSAASEPVVVVDETLARREFAGEALGGYLRIDDRTDARIVGVVGATHVAGLDRPANPTFYVPLTQAAFGLYPDWGMDVVVRTDGAPLDVLPAVRSVMREMDPTLPVFAARPLEDLVADSLGARRRVRGLVGVFSAMALALAAVGVYGVLSQLARERAREFGLRLAIGARPSQVGTLVLADGLRMAGLGIAIGACLALVTGRALEALLYGIGPHDPVSLGATAAALASAATLAALPSIRRVRRLDPARVLRDD